MNENGYPIISEENRQGCTGGTRSQNSAEQMDKTGAADGGKCGGAGCPHDLTLAYLYAPDQKFRLLYSSREALSKGTLFEELYKPMEVYGNEQI